MNLRSRVIKAENVLGANSNYCKCRALGRPKELTAKTCSDFLGELFNGSCETCRMPHLPPGYGWVQMSYDSAGGVESEGLKILNAECEASFVWQADITAYCSNCNGAITGADPYGPCPHCRNKYPTLAGPPIFEEIHQ